LPAPQHCLRQFAIFAWPFLLLVGCATCEVGTAHQFDAKQDGFAFRNELKWAYSWDSEGKMQAQKAEPEPEYIHHCFPMTRAAREFFYHARFEPSAPKIDEAAYHRLVKKVVERDSRCPSSREDQVAIPGFANLHEFSAAYPELLEKGCGSARDSYFQRGNWRMVFPFTRRGQVKVAKTLAREIEAGFLPVVHVTDFPTHTINHALLIFAVEEREGNFNFSAYDPNDPTRGAKLVFKSENKSFEFERNNYFAGGKVNVYEVYRNLFY